MVLCGCAHVFEWNSRGSGGACEWAYVSRGDLGLLFLLSEVIILFFLFFFLFEIVFCSLLFLTPSSLNK